LAVVSAALAGLLIGFPSLRVRGPYFSLLALVAPIILLRLFVFFSDVTGGETGLFGIETLSLDPVTNYYIAFAVFLFALAVFLGITRSDAGQVLTAIREDEDAVVSVGLNPAKFKLFAFVLSGLIGGLAGAMYGHSVGSFTPSELLALVISIEVIIAAILGGIGTITGAAIGGVFFYMLRTYLRNVDFVVPVVETSIGEFYFLVFGLVTLAFLFFLPQGIVPRLVQEGYQRFGTEEGDAIADGGKTQGSRVVEDWVDELRDILGGDRK
jgi:branched-chain amino acid transport system permease protein